MQLKCIVIENEPKALETIKAYLAKMPSVQLLRTFYDITSTYDFLQHNQIDLLFIDIDIPTGTELVKSVKHKLMTIVTTAYKKYAFKGFELEAVDFLLKPLHFERFRKAVNRAVQFHKYRQYSLQKEENCLLVKSEHTIIRINLDEIEYIEGFADYIRIHVSAQKPVLTLMTFKAILDKLPHDRFRRIHRSYIIPLSKVKSIKSKKVLLLSLKELPVSDTYFEFINQWKGGKNV